MLINLHLERWTNDDRQEIVYVDQLTLAILRANLRLGGGTLLRRRGLGSLRIIIGTPKPARRTSFGGNGIRKVFLVEGAIRGEIWGLL